MSMEQLQKWATHLHWPKKPSSIAYRYPIDKDIDSAAVEILIEGIVAGDLSHIGPFTVATSPDSHIGPFLNAVDFLVPDGTTVRAADSGYITEIVDGNTLWGDGPEFRDYLNYITIIHEGGSRDGREIKEYTQYCHLAAGSIKLHVGDPVVRGQEIARVGKSGWTDRDHLHFIVFEDANNEAGFQSLVPMFR